MTFSGVTFFYDVQGGRVVTSSYVSDLLCFWSVSMSECVDGWCNIVFLGVRV